MKLRYSTSCACILLCALQCLPLHAQSPTGEIRLTAQDSSGAAMQASGKLANRDFQRDAQGKYRVWVELRLKF